jgi:hypothetical protein
MSMLWGLLIAITIMGVTSGFVIWIVSKLGLGLEMETIASGVYTRHYVYHLRRYVAGGSHAGDS